MRQCTGCKKELYQLYRESSFGTPIYDDEQLFRVLCYKILQNRDHDQNHTVLW